MRYLLAIVFLLLWFCHAWGGHPYPYNTCVEVYNGNAGGSGTLVGVKDGKGLVISCAHVFEGNNRSPKVRFSDSDTRLPAQLVGINPSLDLSALTIDAPKGCVSAKSVRAAEPTDGTLTAIGYPWYSRGRSPHYTKGKYLEYRDNDVKFLAKPYVHSGFSGGGLFAPDGAMVGVVCGYGEGYSYAASGQAFERFTGKWLKVEKK